MRSPLFLLALLCLPFGDPPAREPLKETFENSAAYRWLNKDVLEARPLDDMETLTNWSGFTTGADPIVDARVIAKPAET